MTRALEILKNVHFNGLLLSKVYTVWIIFHETEERYKIWRGIDFSFQNCHKEYDKTWPEYLEVSKKFILVGSYWANYLFFELKKNRRIFFHETEKESKIWRGINLSFQNRHKKFDKFWPEHLKVSKISMLMGGIL